MHTRERRKACAVDAAPGPPDNRVTGTEGLGGKLWSAVFGLGLAYDRRAARR